MMCMGFVKTRAVRDVVHEVMLLLTQDTVHYDVLCISVRTKAYCNVVQKVTLLLNRYTVHKYLLVLREQEPTIMWSSMPFFSRHKTQSTTLVDRAYEGITK
ncbi:hypothetical protein DPMN_149885 [Dreissena polymorpha]|uniref:Uncharacterized protein n=1 Tax=Dreissena polymorpha TaxID=45954 RepID=A0A9D4FGN4_DREPO|nr:hypothetical protein DPMN_149885 [Dreissena polymorpha]